MNKDSAQDKMTQWDAKTGVEFFLLPFSCVCVCVSKAEFEWRAKEKQNNFEENKKFK